MELLQNETTVNDNKTQENIYPYIHFNNSFHSISVGIKFIHFRENIISYLNCQLKQKIVFESFLKRIMKNHLKNT